MHALGGRYSITSRLSPKSHIFMCTRLALALLAEPDCLLSATPAEGTKQGWDDCWAAEAAPVATNARAATFIMMVFSGVNQLV